LLFFRTCRPSTFCVCRHSVSCLCFFYYVFYMLYFFFFFFFNDTATTEIYTLSLHDALPICGAPTPALAGGRGRGSGFPARPRDRSEEHTSELQSRENLVCRLLLEKKKKKKRSINISINKYNRQPN